MDFTLSKNACWFAFRTGVDAGSAAYDCPVMTLIRRPAMITDEKTLVLRDLVKGLLLVFVWARIWFKHKGLSR
jgi:hypothetical protein